MFSLYLAYNIPKRVVIFLKVIWYAQSSFVLSINSYMLIIGLLQKCCDRRFNTEKQVFNFKLYDAVSSWGEFVLLFPAAMDLYSLCYTSHSSVIQYYPPHIYSVFFVCFCYSSVTRNCSADMLILFLELLIGISCSIAYTGKRWRKIASLQTHVRSHAFWFMHMYYWVKIFLIFMF